MRSQVRRVERWEEATHPLEDRDVADAALALNPRHHVVRLGHVALYPQALVRGELSEPRKELVRAGRHEARGDHGCDEAPVRGEMRDKGAAVVRKGACRGHRGVGRVFLVCRARGYVHRELPDERPNPGSLHYLRKDQAVQAPSVDTFTVSWSATHLVSALMVPKNSTAPVPCSMRRSARRV